MEIQCKTICYSIHYHEVQLLSIELPVATRHRRDMTEKLLKAMLNPNKQQQQLLSHFYETSHLTIRTDFCTMFCPYYAHNVGWSIRWTEN